MTKQVLAYFMANNELTIKLHTAESKTAIGPADIVKEQTFNVNDFPAEFQDSTGVKSLALYGLTKLLQDRTSQRTESADAKFDGMVAEALRLQTADAEGVFQWRKSVERAASAPRSARKVDLALVKAVAELKGVSESVAEANLLSLDKEKIAALTANEKIAALIAKYKEEVESAKQGSDVDLSDLL